MGCCPGRIKKGHSLLPRCLGLSGLAVGLALFGSARSFAGQERFDSGQNVAPVYEGWMKEADGSFTFYFGYMNRNWVERPVVPVGAGNSFSPGPPDRGQPTFFYPRRNQFVFAVKVPPDWGAQQRLVWTLTVNGQTEQAFGWLQPEWQIDSLVIAENARTRSGRTPEEIYGNKPPSISIDPVRAVNLATPLRLTASITDDGLPSVRPKRPPRTGLSTLSAPSAPVNLPTYRTPMPPQNDLSVLWTVYRGPADVAFEPSGFQVATGGTGKSSGKTTTTARFKQPGTYTLRATAADGLAFTSVDVTVTVTGPTR
jgi:hypothetical protein